MNPIKVCCVTNCTNKIHGSFRGGKESYCRKHYNHMQRNGEILERTVFSSNKHIKHGIYTEIILYNNKCKETSRTKIDTEDIERIKRYKWRLSNTGYVVTTLKSKDNLFLHRVICNTPKGMFTDHKNNNKLDNRKKNLRIVDKHQNNINRKGLNKDNTSGHRGVHRYKNSGWFARITIRGKVIFLGLYKDIKDAVKAIRKGEIKYLGKEAKYIKLKINKK